MLELDILCQIPTCARVTWMSRSLLISWCPLPPTPQLSPLSLHLFIYWYSGSVHSYNKSCFTSPDSKFSVIIWNFLGENGYASFCWYGQGPPPVYQGVFSSRYVRVSLDSMTPSFSCSCELWAELIMLLKEALVVDPVMVATSGDVLAGSSVLPVFRYM